MKIKKYLPGITSAVNCLMMSAVLFIAPSMATAAGQCADKHTGEGESKIVFLHLNDMHAKINDLPKVAKYVERQRKEFKDVIFVNAGDNFSGNPVVDQYKPKGEPIIKLLEKLKFDVWSIGNHDFDYGQKVLTQVMKNSPAPLISANIKVVDSIVPQPKPYIIHKTKSGLKVAIIGVIEVNMDNMIPSSHPDKVKGIQFLDPIETAKKYKYLKDQSDIFVAVTHLGIEGDKILAQQMPELDLIIGGHSHTRINGVQETNGVMIAQAGSYARQIGRVVLTVKDGGIIKKESALIKTKMLTDENQEFKELVVKYNKNPYLNQVIANLPQTLEGKEVLGNLITDAVRHVHKLDVGFHNRGGIRLRYLKNNIKVKIIYRMLPFGNEIIRIKMTEPEIISMLAFDFNRHGRMDAVVSGIHYDIIKDADNKIKEIKITDTEGKPIPKGKILTVGMNTYMYSSYNFKHSDPGESLHMNVASTLIKYLKECKDPYKGLDEVRTREIEETK